MKKLPQLFLSHHACPVLLLGKGHILGHIVTKAAKRASRKKRPSSGILTIMGDLGVLLKAFVT
jgi:hypothetical protein